MYCLSFKHMITLSMSFLLIEMILVYASTSDMK